MKKLLHLSLVLDSNQYHAGLLEICHQFEDSTSDEYLNGLVASLAQANNALFDVMHIKEARITVMQENRQLTERLKAASGYIEPAYMWRTLRQRPAPLRSGRCSTPTASRLPG